MMARYRLVLTICLCVLLVFPGVAYGGETERTNGYFVAVDEQNNEIFATAHELEIGDTFIAANNIEYQVKKIKGDKVYLKKLGKVSLLGNAGSAAIIANDMIVGERTLAQADQGKGKIAIYQTHSDESYVPSDGTESKKGNGGIVKVGETLSESFEKAGVKAIHSTVSHYPHDGMAYERSRRTAAQLLKEKPYALFDVHRDAAPAEKYAKIIEGKGYTKIMMVIGKQNPNYNANLAFAKKLKAAVDKEYPGLIQGILLKNGKYNQDLSPRAVLLEFGAHRNARESAERAAAAFAAATNNIVGGQGPAAAPTPVETRGNVSSALIWLGVIGFIGIGGFMLLNGMSLKEMGGKISREFASAIKSIQIKRKK